jgi:rRNA maturation protein Nop10
MKKIYYNAAENTYTFSEYTNGIMNKSVIPPKFSPTDKFGTYRRKAKETQR